MYYNYAPPAQQVDDMLNSRCTIIMYHQLNKWIDGTQSLNYIFVYVTYSYIKLSNKTQLQN